MFNIKEGLQSWIISASNRQIPDNWQFPKRAKRAKSVENKVISRAAAAAAPGGKSNSVTTSLVDTAEYRLYSKVKYRKVKYSKVKYSKV